MSNQPCLPGRSDGACTPQFSSQATIHVDPERVPVTFGWWLYAQERFVGRCHLETLYRLDRVGPRPPGPGQTGNLQPSAYYGQSTEKLRELLRVRQHSLLPRVPVGHRWIGPQLVREGSCGALEPTGRLAAPPPCEPLPRNARHGSRSPAGWPAGSSPTGIMREHRPA